MSRAMTAPEYAGKLQRAGCVLTSWTPGYGYFDAEVPRDNGVLYFRVMFVEGGGFQEAYMLDRYGNRPSGLAGTPFRSMVALERALGIAS